MSVRECFKWKIPSGKSDDEWYFFNFLLDPTMMPNNNFVVLTSEFTFCGICWILFLLTFWLSGNIIILWMYTLINRQKCGLSCTRMEINQNVLYFSILTLMHFSLYLNFQRDTFWDWGRLGNMQNFEHFSYLSHYPDWYISLVLSDIFDYCLPIYFFHSRNKALNQVNLRNALIAMDAYLLYKRLDAI